MSLTDRLKNAFVARDEKAESDIEPDPHVAGSREGGSEDEDGRYVGRTQPEVDLTSGQDGAEARTEAKRQGVTD
jgi:hypothetical protein